MPDDNNNNTGSKGELQGILDSIFSAKNWREKVEEEVRNHARTRRKNRDLTLKVEELEKKVPKDGVVLSKDDAEEFTAFKALNVKAKDLKALQTEHATLKAKDEERAAEEQFAAAGEALGWQNIPALTRFLKRENLVLDFKDVREKDEESGKTQVVRMPVVRPKADDKAAFVPLDEYVEQEVPEFVDVFANLPESEDDEEEGGAGDEEGGELVGAAPRGGIRTMTRTEKRVRTGVPIAGTPRARTGTASVGTKDKKVLEQAEADARNSGTYSL